jgi:hypothetical protein
MMSSLRAGYGEVKITPPLGTDLTGFGFYLNRRAESVLDDLKARALYLDDQSVRLLIISCDLLGFSVSRSDRIRTQVGLRFGLPIQNILLACTHTHSGPATEALAGLGRMNHRYVRGLPRAVAKAAELAVRSAASAELGWAIEAVEPIGFNRRLGSFQEIDPWLKVVVIRQDGRRLYLLNYACHAVTLGPTRAVSADWPGALVREIEGGGDRGLLVQGFCGDIDPVAYLNRRLGADAEDLRLYGRILAARARKAEKGATFSARIRLQAAERRIRLPLLVPGRRDLEREVHEALESRREFPKTRLIIRHWKKRAEKHHAALRRSPWMDNIPLQALSLGGLKILGLPGEVFCEYGLKLRKRWPELMTAGYANGDIGYLPTRRAFRTCGDYACTFAPKFYALFPFSPAIESTLLGASGEILSSF